MRPFLRWAGGKRWLAATKFINFPATTRYVEPFLGGGAILFSQNAHEALIADLNPYLINAYIQMRDAPKELFGQLQQHFDNHDREYYYKVRSNLGTETLADAAAFIYLNRSCFNGLFRVNLSGKFNVPIGSKAFVLRDANEFLAWGAHLQNVEIKLSDFEATIDSCRDTDCLFIDPPYTVNHNSNGFIEYNEKIFSWEDQVRLAACLSRAKKRGVHFLLTNANHDSIRELYSNEYTLTSRERGSEMASRTANRGKTTELLIASSAEIVGINTLI